MRGLSPREGLRALERLLAADAPQVAVMAVDWPQFYKLYPALARMPLLEEFGDEGPFPAAPAVKGEGLKLDLLSSASPDERLRLLTEDLRERVARVMEIPPTALDINQPLTSLGIDSLMAIELKNEAEDEFGVSIPVVNFLQGDSLAQLAGYLAGRLAGGPTASGVNAESPAAEAVAEAAWEEGEV
jgi:acyl carrier protein